MAKALSADDKYKLNNNAGTVAFEAQLGDLIDDALQPDSITQAELDLRSTYETFDGPVIQSGPNGAAVSTADGAVNLFSSPLGNIFESKIVTADSGASTAPYVTYDADGIDISMDKTDDDIYEMNQGITSRSKAAFVAGTDDFYAQARIKVADVSGNTDLAFGFRKAEAYQSAIDNYDEMAVLNVISGDIKIETILNGGTTATTDTTDNLADGEYLDARIEVKSSVGLASAILLANEARSDYSAHLLDTADHTTSADTTNVLTAPAASDLTTLIALVSDLLTQYDAHEGDSELGAAWVYHAAQEAGDHSLASAVAPTDLPECIARINDFKTKFNAHDADSTTHGVGNKYQLSTTSASSTTFKIGINGTAIAAPTVTTQFTFDDGEVVLPFLYYQFDATTPGVIQVQQWESGLLL